MQVGQGVLFQPGFSSAIVARACKQLKMQGARRVARRRHTRRCVNRLLKVPQETEDKAKSAEEAPYYGCDHEHFEALFNAVSRLLRHFQQPVHIPRGMPASVYAPCTLNLQPLTPLATILTAAEMKCLWSVTFLFRHRWRLGKGPPLPGLSAAFIGVLIEVDRLYVSFSNKSLAWLILAAR